MKNVMKTTKKNRFIKEFLPWILAAVLVIVIPLAARGMGVGFEKISYDKRSNESSNDIVEHTPHGSADMTPDLPIDTGLADATPDVGEEVMLIHNTSTKKIHISDCRFAECVADKNRREIYTLDVDGTISRLEEEGYTLCTECGKNRQQ